MYHLGAGKCSRQRLQFHGDVNFLFATITIIYVVTFEIGDRRRLKLIKPMKKTC
jgi:hypothetical protein